MDEPSVSRRARTELDSPDSPHDALRGTRPPSPPSPRALPIARDTSRTPNESSLLSASSPSRALSRIWDRFSPPAIASPFSLPQPTPASRRRPRSGSVSPPIPNASPAGSEDFTRRRLPPRLEQHDSASQLSFSLRRASAGANTHQVDERDSFRARTASVNSLAESWESFRLPGVARWRSLRDKGKDVASDDGEEEEDEEEAEVSGVADDDEACFVDEWSGKVDFIVSLPSEISLFILFHLDFQSLLTCGLVSRQWRVFALDPLLWRGLFHQHPKWSIKPEVYRAAALAAQRSASQTPTNGQSPAGGSGYFDSRPSMPNLRRAASSFGKAGVKKVVNGADRVSQGGANFGKRLSGIVNDIGNMSLSSPNGSRSGSRAPSEAGSASTEPAPETPSRPRTLAARRTTATALMTMSTPAAPSTSTLPTHAFASPPSTSLTRTNSATALSSLASSISSLPLSRNPSTKRPASPFIPPPSPALSLSFSLDFDTPTYLDWPKLYRDRWLIEKRWHEGTPSWNWLEGHEDSVYCVQFDDKKVVSGSRDKTIRVWDTASGTTTRILKGHEGSILCLQYDDEILLSGSSDSRILMWDLVGDEGTGRGKYEVKMTLVGHAMAVLDLCFNDTWIVSSSKDTTTRVWHRKTGEFFRSLSGHRGPVNAVALNSNRILTASGDALMKMWDVETGKALRTFAGHTRGLACVQWSPDGKEIVSAGNDQVIKLWNADTGECLKEFKGHTDLVRGLSFDMTSRRIVSVGYDKTTRVWDVDSEGTAVEGDTTGRRVVEAKHRFKSHASLVFDVDFDVSRIVSSSHDRRILLMDFAVGLDVSKFAS
ncbi:hypothetical protein JCM11491_005364 [Sporobolomyces phaffii]